VGAVVGLTFLFGFGNVLNLAVRLGVPLWPARRLLIFASVVTLALNVAEPLVTGQFRKAAFDPVGPLLLIGWSEVGPGLMQAIGTASRETAAHQVERREPAVHVDLDGGEPETEPRLDTDVRSEDAERQSEAARRRLCWLKPAAKTRLIV